LLYILLRPDHEHRLVSMPYYTKYAYGGDKTSFRHIDVNIRKLAEGDAGSNMIQGTLSFDDKSKDDYTELLIGMHKHIPEWWRDIKAAYTERSESIPDGAVQAIDSKTWSREMASKYERKGVRWVPRPCKRGEVRVSLPHLPHGALGPAKRVRRTLLPWYVSVDERHAPRGDPEKAFLEIPEAGTVGAVAEGHRTLQAGAKTPSGLPLVRTDVPFPFPPAGHLDGLGPISDALVGRISYDSYEWCAEFAEFTALNTTYEDFRRYLNDWSHTAKSRLLKKYKAFESIERQAYGEKSWYWRRDHNLLDTPIDDDFSNDVDPDRLDPNDHLRKARQKEPRSQPTGAPRGHD
jgi:hypothetical protein